VITDKARTLAKKYEDARQEALEETQFAQDHSICPRCAVPLKPHWLWNHWTCPSCKTEYPGRGADVYDY
jgi:ribosomal protein L37AE/L43A